MDQPTTLTDEAFEQELFTILGYMQYNGTRAMLLEDILKDFLLKPSKMDIQSSVKSKDESQRFKKFNKQTLFEKQFHLGGTNLYPSQGLYESVKRYDQFSDILKEDYGFSTQGYVQSIRLIIEKMNIHCNEIDFSPDEYQFKTKEEHTDTSFVSPPSKKYTENWKSVIQLNKQKIFDNVISTQDFIDEFGRVVEILSFTLEEFKKKDGKIHFQLKPILKINEEKFVLLTPHYLARCAPINLDVILRSCKRSKEYIDVKGTHFEKMALGVLSKLPHIELETNIPYQNGELDGLLNTKDTSWFVEISSRPPNIKSLEGDEVEIDIDIERSIEKCKNQALKAISMSNILAEKVKIHAKKGIIIVVDGIYPNFSTLDTYEKMAKSGLNFWENGNQDSDVPTYIINYYDLETIVMQSDNDFFGEFLEWRTQKKMPVLCMDEKDYWAFFEHYRKDYADTKGSFKRAQEKMIFLIYNSARFNNKSYLEEIAPPKELFE